MKLNYRVNEKLSFEVDADGQKQIFEALATLDEVFGERQCGQCKNTDIYFHVRNVTAQKGKNKGKTFTYYELTCRKCGAFLPFGQHLEGGTLYPNRKLDGEDGERVFDKDHLGWRKPNFRQEDEEEEQEVALVKNTKSRR